MAYSDHEIGRIVETLEKLDLFENTLISRSSATTA